MLLKNPSIVLAVQHITCSTFFFFPNSLTSDTFQCNCWGQTKWESDGRNQHWFPHRLRLFLSILLGTLRFVCFVFLSFHFLPRNFTAALMGVNPAWELAMGARGLLKMLETLCFLKHLFEKSEFTQLVLNACCAREFVTHRYKLLPRSPLLSYWPQCTNSTSQGRKQH